MQTIVAAKKGRVYDMEEPREGKSLGKGRALGGVKDKMGRGCPKHQV
jgi:hypothetical protein